MNWKEQKCGDCEFAVEKEKKVDLNQPMDCRESPPGPINILGIETQAITGQQNLKNMVTTQYSPVDKESPACSKFKQRSIFETDT